MPTDYEKEIGARVAAHMRKLDWTPAQLARELNLTSHSSIRKIMSGHSVFQWTQLAKLAGLLQTSPNELLGLEHKPSLDETLVLAAVQGILEQLGFERDMAQIGAKLAVETAKEHRVLQEDPATEVRVRAKLAIAAANLLK
jgi:transcriptional regulator with XRE-family HTH domain